MNPPVKEKGMTSEEEKIQNYALFCIRMQLLHVYAYGAHMHRQLLSQPGDQEVIAFETLNTVKPVLNNHCLGMAN